MKTKADKTGQFSELRLNGRAVAGPPLAQCRARAATDLRGTAYRDQRSIAVAQRAFQHSITNSPRQGAQAERLSGVFGAPVQRVADDEELKNDQIKAAKVGVEASKNLRDNNKQLPDVVKSSLVKEQGRNLGSSEGPVVDRVIDMGAGLLGYDPVPGPAGYAAAPGLFVNDRPGTLTMNESAQSSDIESRGVKPRSEVLGNVSKGAAFADAVGDIATIGAGVRDWYRSKKALKKGDTLSTAEKQLLKKSLQTGQKETAKGALSGTKTGLTIAANAGADVAGVARLAGLAGAGLNFIGGARNLRKGYRAYKRFKNLKKILKAHSSKPMGMGLGQNSQAAGMIAVAKYAEKKNRRKRNRSLLSGTGAMLSGVGGTILGLGALGVGGAIAATPVGWALAAAGGALGLGVGAWKLGRWAYKIRHRKARVKPDKKHGMAVELFKAYRAEDDTAKEIVKALNLRQNDLKALKDAPEDFGAALLERKLASW